MYKVLGGRRVVSRVFIAGALLVVLVPLLWILLMAFKRPNEIYQSYLFFFPKHFTFENFPGAVEFATKALGLGYVRMYFNSAVATGGGLVLAMITASFAAFSMVYYRFRSKELFYTFMLLSYMIPVQVLLIPLFLVLMKLSMLSTYWGLIFPYATIGVPIAVLILRSFFTSIPAELVEAARIDGARSFQVFSSIYVPLARPAIATCVIFLFLEMWNEFLFAFIFIRKDSLQTLPLAMSRIGMGGRFPIPWGVYGASIFIAIVPIFVVFMFFQKWFVRGMLAGAIKG
jgi:ABC-type glycerol-3-phosphate transport system permease component